MTHRVMIDLRVINYLNSEKSLNQMFESEKINNENLGEHLLNFYSFIINIKTLNDSLIYQISSKEKIKEGVKYIEENDILNKQSLEVLEELKSVRDYFIHHKKLESFLFGTTISYVDLIKNEKKFEEFLSNQKDIDGIWEETKDKRALILTIKYLKKEKSLEALEIAKELLEKAEVSRWAIESKKFVWGG